jgi:hypothetical protein
MVREWMALVRVVRCLVRFRVKSGSLPVAVSTAHVDEYAERFVLLDIHVDRMLSG